MGDTRSDTWPILTNRVPGPTSLAGTMNTQKPSTKKPKPDKPYADFPLFPHGNGQWAKKIRGRLHYFGPWADHQAAVDEYNRVRDDLYAGRARPPKDSGVELRYAVNAFLTAKEKQVDAEHLLADTLAEYRRTCGRILNCLSAGRSVTTLGVADFTHFREWLADNLESAITIKNELTRAKTFFRWLSESGLLAAPLPYREALKPPSRRIMRREKKQSPKRKTFTAAEIKSLLKHAHGWKKPAIYLGVNCGIGNRDLCELEWDHIDLAGGWIDFPRPKTYVDRRAKLWPETVAALRAWLKLSPESAWVCCYADGQQIGQGETSNNPVAHRFREVMTTAKIDVDANGDALKKGQGGRGFYALRHTFRTIADGCKDPRAVAYVMGHADDSIAANYTHGIEDQRLEAVAQWVRDWFKSR